MIQYVDLLSDTICSQITAPGHAGVSVIRISGEKALEITATIVPKLKLPLQSHHTYFSKITSPSGDVIDEALITYFEKGKSFTGDETIEIACHGNPLLVNRIVDLYLNKGARSAERGEFSFRAFYNGKLDLVQAESIHNLVTNNTQFASSKSLNQLMGDLSDKFKEIEEGLVLALSHLEATIDFVEQDIDPNDYKAVAVRIEALVRLTNELLKSYDVGKNLNKGHKVLLLGATNVGKSSLFNKLFNEERAIVTDIAGTTRDLVRGQTFLGNSSIEFIDSAGLRESEDERETIGIQKSLTLTQEADVVLFVIDQPEDINKDVVKSLPVDKTIFVLNKVDQEDSDKRGAKSNAILNECNITQKTSRISALTGHGVTELKNQIEEMLKPSEYSDEKIVVTQARHFNHLSSLASHLEHSLSLIEVEESPDLISQELSLGLMEIHQLLGKEYNDEVLDKIFSDFCIGK